MLKKKEKISNEKVTLTLKNQNLKKKVAVLKLVIKKFTLSSDKL